MSAPPNDNAPAPTDSDLDRVFSGLLAEVGKDNDRAAKALHELCRVHPELWEKIGGLEHSALESWKALFSAGPTNRRAFLRDHIDGELSRRRTALHADGSSQLETLLINRILSAWLHVMYADAAYTQMLKRRASFQESEYHQKRLERANRQLLRAIQALATVRRLLRPVQVNIGQNQINVAG
jgi:hypothetical protein